MASSPEILVRVRNGKVTIRPIAGTRKRGKTINEDIKLSNDLINDEKVIAFDDGKWTFATYASKSDGLEEALYLMRQLNIALNRDINKLKRVIFTSDENTLVGLLSDYPRVEIVIDSESKLFKKLFQAGNESFFEEQKIFIIDPYGRAVMFFPVSLDPKLILKDLKVLI